MLISELTEFFTQWQASNLVGLSLLGAAFFIGNFIPIPRHPLCILAGVMYGFSSIGLAFVTCTTGAALAFLLSRYLFQNRLLTALEAHATWKAIVKAIDAEGYRIVFLLRLASPIPGPLNNYLFGLTRIGFWPYSLCTAVGLFPTITVFTYLGAAGRTALTSPNSITELATIAAGVVIGMIVVGLIARRAKAELAKAATS